MIGDTDRIRAIVKTMRECNEDPTLEAVNAQFRHETGRDLPQAWARTPPPWLVPRVEPAGAASVPPRLGDED